VVQLGWVLDDEHGFFPIFWAKKSPISVSDQAGGLLRVNF
jgi:hypothetical protein